jgi:NAD(P)-dependent dehydrogenase (short-subunit alcohol dehydrogenase family)
MSRPQVASGVAERVGIARRAAERLETTGRPVLQQWGRLDIVVNNAGMISAANPVFESGTVESMNLATWQAGLARNLTSAFLVTNAGLSQASRPAITHAQDRLAGGAGQPASQLSMSSGSSRNASCGVSGRIMRK